MNPKTFIGLMATVLAIAPAISSSQALGQNPSNTTQVTEAIKQKARQLVSQRTGVSINSLAVVNSATVNYPLQGKIAFAIKVRDLKGGLSGITLDGNGQELSSAQLRTNEQAAYTALYGKLHPSLAQKLASAPQDQPIRVMLWLKQSSSAKPQRPAPNNTSNSNDKSPASLAQVNAFYQQVDAQRAATVQPLVTSIANRLRSVGNNVRTEKYSPVVYASLTPQAISQVGQWSEVDRVYEDQIMKPLMETARPAIGADVVEGRGITGSGVQVAEIEVGGRINTSNPYLAGITQDTTYSCLASHAAAVAGDIRSTHPTVRGIAPNVSLWIGGSCGGWGSELTERSTVAADWGARAFNLSLGGESDLEVDGFARFYDDMVINRWRTVVVAAGNSGYENGNVGTPAVAYNIITVGSFDDKNTSSWNDDEMSGFSSWRDPISTHGDREKPEVAAPGTNINSTTNSSPWIGPTGSGTSYAAPIVTGIAAQLIQRNSSLSVWPEAIKAIVMTTAVNDLEGDTRLSEYDGAGGVTSNRADDVARGVGGNWGGQSYSCDATSPATVATVSLTAGQQFRATIAWDNDPNYSSYSSQPGADLDFEVVDSSGNSVTGSYSWDNTYEIVQFTPSSSGTYKLNVKKYRCDYSPSWLGWAWHQGN